MVVRIAEYKADILKEAENSSSRNYEQTLLTAALNYQGSVVRQKAGTPSSSSGRFHFVYGK